jgi:hypothetical protein
MLHGSARDALARGDYARAAALIGDAELLAADVHGLVDDIEHRENDQLMGLAAEDAVQAEKARRRAAPRRTLRLALGATLVMSLALTTC